jgi:hypothetical protein
MAYHWNRYTKIAATLPLAFLERPYKYLQKEIIFNGLAFIYSISSAVGGISVVLLILHQIDVMDKIVMKKEAYIQLGNSPV